MVFLCREAVQGHIGVEPEHVLVQLVVLQRDSINTQMIKSWIICKTHEEAVKSGVNRRRLFLPAAFHWRDELADR